MKFSFKFFFLHGFDLIGQENLYKKEKKKKSENPTGKKVK